MSTPPDTYAGYPLAGPGLDVWAGLGVRLESLTAAIREDISRRERLWACLHEIPLTGPPLTEAGQVTDQPPTLGPQLGYWWDIRRLAFSAPGQWQAPAGGAEWAGTIWVFAGLPAAPALLCTFTPDAPARFFSKSALMLQPGQRLVCAAGADFTGGPAIMTGAAVTVCADCVPMYRG